MKENYSSFCRLILCNNLTALLHASCILVRKKLEKRLCLTGTRGHSLFPYGKVVKMPKIPRKKARKKPKHSSFLSISTIFSSEWLDLNQRPLGPEWSKWLLIYDFSWFYSTICTQNSDKTLSNIVEWYYTRLLRLHVFCTLVRNRLDKFFHPVRQTRNNQMVLIGNLIRWSRFSVFAGFHFWR